MNNLTLPQGLAPLILPEPISYWPLAIGWWLLGLLFASLLVASYTLYQRQQHRQTTAPTALDAQHSLKLSTLQQLQLLAPPVANLSTAQWLQQLNQLLKRVAMTRYAEQQPHTLTGRDWLAFLDSRCPSAGLTRWMILVEGPYKANCQLSLSAQQALYQSVTHWINKHV